MIHRSTDLPDDTEDREPSLAAPTLGEMHRMGKTQEELAYPRCPLCRGILVIRLGRAGPYFACACAARRSAVVTAWQTIGGGPTAWERGSS